MCEQTPRERTEGRRAARGPQVGGTYPTHAHTRTGTSSTTQGSVQTLCVFVACILLCRGMNQVLHPCNVSAASVALECKLYLKTLKIPPNNPIFPFLSGWAVPIL